MNNYCLCIKYDGASFFGFQSQPNQRNVQDKVFAIIRKIFGKINKHSFSGRTDSGVHAENQHIHFVSDKKVDIQKTEYSISRMLPIDISIVSLRYIRSYKDARREAVSREYKYLFAHNDYPYYLNSRIVKVNNNCSIKDYNNVAQVFIGTHDFIYFRKKGSEEKSSIRTIENFSFKNKLFYDIYDNDKSFNLIEAHIQADSFLYRMVRNIMGAVFEVVSGRKTIESLQELLKTGSGKFNYPVVQAKGLTLYKVNY
ncbi:tRNA pseudouridine(38-40) synthase TruA [Candidatus Marinamargulisbacteria bacterium SCGC AAA071-K20]|nr:tRNA pseudouridine(38-40) synthase TruA [Candidatus Marinamargulisbacteria bacterium SCGC AAA071-K20]